MSDGIVFKSLNYVDHFPIISRVYVSLLQYRLYFAKYHTELTALLENTDRLSNTRPCAIPSGLRLLINADGTFRESGKCIEQAYNQLAKDYSVTDPEIANKALVSCYMGNPDFIERQISELFVIAGYIGEL